jgi:cytoskeletal protein RodZ
MNATLRWQEKEDTKRGRSPRSSPSGKKKKKKRDEESNSTSSSSSGTSEWIHTISKIKGRKKAIKKNNDGQGDSSIRVKSFLIPFKAAGETTPASTNDKSTTSDLPFYGSDTLKEIKEILRKGAFLENKVHMTVLNTPEWTEIITSLARMEDIKQLAGLNNIDQHGSKSAIVNRIVEHLQSEF